NILIHLLTAGFLYLTIERLTQSPNMTGRKTQDAAFIALLASALWAVNPIQTQAVTYIVQRMATLAALFTIVGMYCYLRARLTPDRKISVGFLLSCAACFLLGMASKENAIMLPLCIALMEAVFFQDLGNPKIRKRILLIGVVGSSLLLGIGIVVFLSGNPLAVLGGYEERAFTIIQRLLTQPRVLIFYISQIFYPIPGRLSIEHDLVASTSLLCPWTTLPSILLVTGLLVGALLVVRKRPWLSFALLFFFLNHLMESSVIPLELVFEHRNYLPSMFLFVPVAAGFKWLLDLYRLRQPTISRLLAAFGVCLLVATWWGTVIRNIDWKSEASLWEDARVKAPSAGRPVHNLAWAYYETTGQFDQALALYRQASRMNFHLESHRARSLNNMAGIYFRSGDYKDAVTLYERALSVSPDSEAYRFRLAVALAHQNRWEKAMANLETLLAKDSRRFEFLDLKGTILMHQLRPIEALRYFHACIRNHPKQSRGYDHAGAALLAMGELKRAEVLLKFGLGLSPDDLRTRLRLVDVHLRTGEAREAAADIAQVIRSTSVGRVQSALKELANEPLNDPEAHRALVLTVLSEVQSQLGTAPPAPSPGQTISIDQWNASR
ncbi:MAG: tetratricopeptide repeat protein, partial [Desulfobacterales bacterium]